MINFIQFIFSKDYVNATIAVLVGLIAVVLYYKQKFDRKKEAARIILLEIQRAERGIRQVKESLASNE